MMDLHVAGLTDLFTGKWEKIGEVDTHITTPTKNYSKDKAILFLTYAKGVHKVDAEVCVLLSQLYTSNIRYVLQWIAPC